MLPVGLPPAVALFGESPGRVVLTVAPGRWRDLAAICAEHDLPCLRLGTVGGDRFRLRLAGVGATGAAEERGSKVADEIDVPLDDLRRAWQQALPRALGEA